MEHISQVKPLKAEMQLRKQSTSLRLALEREEKTAQIIPILQKLGVRRQAKLDPQDYLILADDLADFDLRDVEAGLGELAKYPRMEGETAFPDVGRLIAATRKAVAERRSKEAQERRERQEREDRETWERERDEDIANGITRRSPSAGGKEWGVSYYICGREWHGKDGKDHKCVLPKDHGLTCECDCGSRKWFGEPSKFNKPKKEPSTHD